MRFTQVLLELWRVCRVCLVAGVLIWLSNQAMLFCGITFFLEQTFLTRLFGLGLSIVSLIVSAFFWHWIDQRLVTNKD